MEQLWARQGLEAVICGVTLQCDKKTLMFVFETLISVRNLRRRLDSITWLLSGYVTAAADDASDAAAAREYMQGWQGTEELAVKTKVKEELAPEEAEEEEWRRRRKEVQMRNRSGSVPTKAAQKQRPSLRSMDAEKQK